MNLRHQLKTIFWKLGYDVSRFSPASHPLARRQKIIQFHGIDTIIDVGANSGQFGQQVRNDLKFSGRIISFEPLGSAFRQLSEKAKDDPNWEIHNHALGDTEGRMEINVAGNSYSSSLLGMLPSHLRSAPDSRYIGKEVILIKTLDSIFGDLRKASRNIYLKVDTQGYEDKVLKGAERSLEFIDTVQMEMSLVPLYEHQALFSEMVALMQNRGYTLIALENGFSDSGTGQLLQVDGIFHRFKT